MSQKTADIQSSPRYWECHIWHRSESSIHRKLCLHTPIYHEGLGEAREEEYRRHCPSTAHLASSEKLKGLPPPLLIRSFSTSRLPYETAACLEMSNLSNHLHWRVSIMILRIRADSLI